MTARGGGVNVARAMISRRLLAILLVGVVLATGIAAAVHAHVDAGASHDGGGCAVCRLAHETAPPSLAPVSLAVVVPSPRAFEAEPIVLHDAELDAVRSPRAPPRPENS